MKKVLSLLLSCALLAGLLILPASAVSYGELSIQVNSPKDGAYVTVTSQKPSGSIPWMTSTATLLPPALPLP